MRRLEEETETCDTHYWGMGLSGGISHFRIVHPGGGLHKNMFQFDIYSNPDGQIDWDMIGPIIQDKHSYKYCGEMQPPTVPPEPTPCDKGMFSIAGDTLSPCRVCPAGTYVDTQGANSCTKCPSGTYNNDGKQVDPAFHDDVSDCLAQMCPPGRYLDSDNAALAAEGQTSFSIESCALCNAGKYSSSVSSESCTDCPAGTYSSQQGSVVCLECVRGKYAAVSGQSSCDSCSAGTYSNVIGANSTNSCVPCYAGSFSAKEGATSVDTCIA